MTAKYEEAKANPSGVYASPKDVLEDTAFDVDQKREILRRWEAEAIHLQESAAEGFGGGERSHLDEIAAALEKLGD